MRHFTQGLGSDRLVSRGFDVRGVASPLRSHTRFMRWRQIWCGLLMLVAAGLCYLDLVVLKVRNEKMVRLTSSDLIRYPIFAFAFAVLVCAGVAGWSWDGILGDKRQSLLRMFRYLFVGGTFFMLIPICAATVLGESENWVFTCRLILTMLTTVFGLWKNSQHQKSGVDPQNYSQ